MDSYRLLFALSLVAIAASCVIAAWIVIRRPLKPFARNLLIALVVFELILAGLHLFAVTGALPPFWRWFFNLQYEMNLATVFSSLQLMVIALVAFVSGLRTSGLRRWQRAYWFFLTAVFVYLSIDEFYMFHETLGGRGESEFWRIPYALAGGVLFLSSLAAYWYGFRNEIRLFVMLFMGLLIMAIGGIGIEEFVLHGFVDYSQSYSWMYMFEELFEMVGATIILAGFISSTQEHLNESGWRFARRFVVGAGATWMLWLFFALLLQPALEARFLATPANAEFGGGLLTLAAYDISSKIVHPGEEIAITLYWRANQSLPEDYSLSLHVLGHPDIVSLAQGDNLDAGPIPSTGWFPHVTVKRTFYLRLPRDLLTPASYWIMLRLWYGPWPPVPGLDGVPVTEAGGRRTLTPDTLILESLPAIPDHEPEPPAAAVEYRFPFESLVLAGYELPVDAVAGNALPVKFWWQTQAKVEHDLTQFFHLLRDDGGPAVVFDQQPFGGRFPTIDWPANLRAVDEWNVPLPDDLAAGTYDAYIGMYDPQTIERSAVVDSEGRPVPNNVIYLGAVTYESDANSVLDLTPFCYAVGVAYPSPDVERDMLVVMNRLTGEVREVGPTGTVGGVEALTFSPDGSVLYTVDERDIGQFGAIDLETGGFSPLGPGVATPDNPARNHVLGPNLVKDADSISVDPMTGRLWAVHQDEENLIFEIDPTTGEIVRDTFGEGNDYVKIDLSSLSGPAFTDVEDMAIDPRDGAFLIIAGKDATYESVLAQIDWDTLNPITGRVSAVEIGPFTSARDDQPVDDVEGLSFFRDGTLYATTSNNSNSDLNHDALWRVDPASGAATPFGSFRDFVGYQDYEGVACLSTGAEIDSRP